VGGSVGIGGEEERRGVQLVDRAMDDD